METQKRRLMWHGMLLFLLGLITGLLEQRFTNVRMGLSAHLEGVMNGTVLLALGAAWNEVRLPYPIKVTAYCGPYRFLLSAVPFYEPRAQVSDDS
jgi:hydroxylaminobenzene mutase